MDDLRIFIDAAITVPPMSEERTVTGEAFRRLRLELDRAALAAFTGGMDWCEGPMKGPPVEQIMAPFNLFDPPKFRCTCDAGPVEPGFVPPAGYRVIRNEDWVKAGKPGLG